MAVWLMNLHEEISKLRKENTKLKEEKSELLTCLDELVDLKFNKPSDYEQRKPAAWENAKITINKIKKF